MKSQSHRSVLDQKALAKLPSLLLLVFLLWFIGCSKDRGSESDDNDNNVEEFELPSGRVMFDVSPIDLSGVVMFEPMGSVGTFPKDHGGFHHNQVGVSEPTIRLYALADGYIDGIGKDVDDYWIQIRYSETISVKLGHVGRLAQSVLDQIGTFSNHEVKHMTIKVEKGQVIGYVSELGAVDMGLHDQESENSFCYPQLFWFETLFASDIFDYFNEPVKSELLSTAIREQPPRGGKVDYDVKGTLAGNWFLSGGDPDAFENHFAIAYDYLHPERIIFYNGYAQFVENHPFIHQVWIKGNGPLPETIDLNSGVVKYELIHKRGWRRHEDGSFTLDNLDGVDEQMTHGIALFEMLDTETMQVEYFPEQQADEVVGFSGNQRIYVRNP